jgi:hypothetical protein
MKYSAVIPMMREHSFKRLWSWNDAGRSRRLFVY